MTLEELLQAGRRLSPIEREVKLKQLLAHEAAPALFAWLEDYILPSYVEHISRQDFADRPGSIQHIAGSIHAAQKIRDELVQLQLNAKAR